MWNTTPGVPDPVNEPELEYNTDSYEREKLREELQNQYRHHVEIPIIIAGEKLYPGNTRAVTCPHDHRHQLGICHQAGEREIKKAIEASLDARRDWLNLPWHQRLSPFLKMAQLLSKTYRFKINAATMLNQSKSVHQAEIDAACELIDFLRFNAHYIEEIYSRQPRSTPGTWNYLDYRPLDGFVAAISPFNFTSIAGNLVLAPAMMGNTIIWKPASTALLSAYYLMELFQVSGIPDGVINFVPCSGAAFSEFALTDPGMGGVHFTGSTRIFNGIWKKVAENIGNYAAYPRLVGETGGKDYIFMHPSADMQQVVTALVRGAFEYQGQKCSACSRAYIPGSRWPELKNHLVETISEIKTGDVMDFENFCNAVIDEKSYNEIMGHIKFCSSSPDAEIIIGGQGSKSTGYFIQPTVIQAFRPDFITMREELFAPVLTIYVYDENKMEETIDWVDRTTPYALTGAIFAGDRLVIDRLTNCLRFGAGNFYINDKPTGAVVGQQPFGGSRASGTNDKSGSMLNLLRWTSPRTVKENFMPPTDFRYPYMNYESNAVSRG